MKTRDVTRAVELWAVAVTESVEELVDLSSYDHPPDDLNEAMPLVICEVQRKMRSAKSQAGGMSFQQTQYEQIAAKAWEVELMILVPPNPAWDASYRLYDYIDALGDALKRDATLGERVSFASKDYEASFDPPEVEYQDGTVARAATMTVHIGEQEEV